ncbi:MAG: carboxypeptidase-like regulatory domain-containing protein, partial [Candidatus Izemoplasmatales bacterium]|nr:carboxypeptidase-like regulatory domain-containing protein [Candidatus Izemoplasmatales bacterium]
LVLSDFTSGSQFENDVTLEHLALSISRTVFNFASGIISGAVVAISGTEYETTSGTDGSYSFTDLHLPSDEFVLTVTHSGYLDAEYSSSDFDDEDAFDLELIADYIPLGVLDAPYLVEGYLTKSSTGFYFQFVADEFRYSAGKEEKVQVYINPGAYTENSRLDGSHTIEIAMTSNNDIVVVVSYLEGVRFLTSILWGTELIYETHQVEDKVVLSLFVKYSVFGDYAGADFAIDQDDVVGLGLNFWTDHDQVNLYHWYRDDMLGVDGRAIVSHNNPQDWVRIAPDGRSIFEGSSNVVLEPQERTVSGVVTLNDNPVENASVTIEGLNISTMTDANGAYTLIVPADKINVSVLTIVATYPDHTFRGSVTRSAFTDHQATLNIALEPVITHLNVSGSVEDEEGLPLEGVTVSIRNTSFVATTDSEGHFEFVDIAHSTTPYVLDFSKEGYKDKSLSQSSLTIVLSEPIVLKEAWPVQVGHEEIILSEDYIYLGTVGPDEFEVYIAYVDGTLKMKYVTTSGSFTNAPFEERLSQYFIFGDNEIYEVRAINGSWTGVFKPESGAWAPWTPEIHNPVITDIEGVYTLSQDIEVSYFTNMGFSLDEIYFCVFEVTAEGSDALIYNDAFQLSIDDSSNWLQLTLPGGDDDDDPIESPVINLTDEYHLLGTFGEDDIVGSIRYVDGAIITQYVIASGAFTSNGFEESIRQYFVFGDSVIYEVRIIPSAWTGVYMPQAGYFGPWTPEIGVPIIEDDGTNVTFTQTIQLSYFADLELDLDNIQFGLFQNTETGNHVLTYDDVELVIANRDTWISLVVPPAIEE